MTIKVLGIDIAKNTFQLHGTDEEEECEFTSVHKLGLNAEYMTAT